MRRKFKSSAWMFLFAFVFMVKVSVQAEPLTKPQSEKRVINLGSSVGGSTQGSYGQEENHYVEYTQRRISLQGKWDLYGTDLGDNHIWTGYILIDKFGDVRGGELKSSRPGDQYVITKGHFDLNVKTGKVKGYFADSEGETTNIEATMHCVSQISGVMINPGGSEEEGIFMLIRTSSLIDYIPYYFPLKQGAVWKYKVTENGQTRTKTIKIDGTKIIDGVSTVKRYVFDSNEEGYFVCMALSKEGVLAYESYSLDLPPSESTYASPPYILFPYKMEMGKEFSSHCLWAEYGDPQGIPPSEFDELVISSRVVELEGIEDVVVPAGEFKGCLRIRISEASDESLDMDSSGDHEVCREEVWLALGVGIVKVSGLCSEFNPTQKIIEKNYYTEELFSYSGLKN